MAKQFAIRLSLIAFSTASFRGLLAGADFEGTIRMALVTAASFFALGLICGELARRVVEESVQLEVGRLIAQHTTGTPEPTEPVGT